MTERDPNGIAPNTPGAKLDAGKPPVARGCLHYFPRAIAAVAAVSATGATKYTWRGWESVPDGPARYADAQARHDLAIGAGESVDGQTGHLHLAHVAWNALARLELALRANEVSS
jgi:hypothetical protein